LATLKEHSSDVVVSFEKANGWITIPEAQTRNFVFSLHMRHAELQDRGLSRAGATHAALTSVQSNGSSSESAQRFSRLSKMVGTLASHAARSGLLRQFAASRAGIGNAMRFYFVAELTR
jgi:predicted carbohydrate-binding protein with CBM5 and CBM33 domain